MFCKWNQGVPVKPCPPQRSTSYLNTEACWALVGRLLYTGWRDSAFLQKSMQQNLSTQDSQTTQFMANAGRQRGNRCSRLSPQHQALDIWMSGCERAKKQNAGKNHCNPNRNNNLVLSQKNRLQLPWGSTLWIHGLNLSGPLAYSKLKWFELEMQLWGDSFWNITIKVLVANHRKNHYEWHTKWLGFSYWPLHNQTQVQWENPSTDKNSLTIWNTLPFLRAEYFHTSGY